MNQPEVRYEIRNADGDIVGYLPLSAIAQAQRTEQRPAKMSVREAVFAAIAAILAVYVLVGTLDFWSM